MRVAGADGCRGGWLMVTTEGASGQASALFLSVLAEALADPAPEVLGVDTPVGLAAAPEPGGRPADRAARAFLAERAGGLRGTGARVFPAPTRAQLQLWRAGGDYAAVKAAHPTGPKPTLQSFHILAKIDEADRLAAAHGPRLAEVHPEVSFALMAGRTLPPKAGPEGRALREGLLAAVGFDLVRLRAGLGPPRGRWQGDDLLDACAACWSAARIARGEARRFGTGAVIHG